MSNGIEPTQKSATHSVSYAESTSGDCGAVGISGDLVLKLFELRTKYISTQLDAAVNAMDASVKRAKALDDMQAALAEYATNGTLDKDGNETAATKQNWIALNEKMKKAAAELPDGDPMQGQMESIRQSPEMRRDGNYNLNGPGTLPNGEQEPADYKVSSSEIQAMQKTIDGLQKQNDSENQTLGMKINQYMNQQQEAATLFSGMQQAIHQALMTTIGNIGKG